MLRTYFCIYTYEIFGFFGTSRQVLETDRLADWVSMRVSRRLKRRRAGWLKRPSDRAAVTINPPETALVSYTSERRKTITKQRHRSTAMLDCDCGCLLRFHKKHTV